MCAGVSNIKIDWDLVDAIVETGMGPIGKPERRKVIEPLSEPANEPVKEPAAPAVAPTPEREPEEVPA